MRVSALQSVTKGIMKFYGEGILIKNQIPDIEPFNELKVENPCIQLDSGKYVWGFECWWGETEKFNKKFEGLERENVEPENIQPLKL